MKVVNMQNKFVNKALDHLHALLEKGQQASAEPVPVPTKKGRGKGAKVLKTSEEGPMASQKSQPRKTKGQEGYS